MNLIPEKRNLNEYLRCSQIIDCDNKLIQKKASQISKNAENEIETAKDLYEFVRDEIHHSSDIKSNEITYKSSDVLNKGHGLCFAKSHLLGAFFRSQGIPAGFCYQKLSTDSGKILHGLNGVYLNDKWIRLDARGNKTGINAQFSLNCEKLAYVPQKEEGDKDYPIIYSNPHPKIINILQSNSTLDDVIKKIVGSL
ncbi:transglutaminase-like domain-containing protein [Methanobacterium alcaliphilum]|uniref:transglutaminase-like domain-containing protein n=1 Tax=Methanobacterium alcaliphilum TaxID=392018 RepID=UPI00200A0087|nr:transglutaminase-like domain-containing protein [Methanobacterium alcaliphilum]MCK9151405.1 transglutaminase-like domain-containing protein [Methanobacterium alcaliphilum]